MGRWLLNFTNLFPLWVILACAAGFVYPPAVTWMSGAFITWGLAVIMLGMGLTLRPEDFVRALSFPRRVGYGVFLQYTVMPLLGWSFASLFALPPEFAAGLILVACCPGGTASNVISFLARGDLGLSVTLTACSTLLAALATPVLTLWLVGDRLDVDPYKLFVNTVQVVVLPVAAGVILNRYFQSATKYLIPFAPPVAVIAIAFIVGSVLARKKEAVLDAGLALLAAIWLLHLSGFALGFVLGKLSGRELTARTLAIEVGMQNSGLGVELARNNFPGTLADIPSAISAVTHCIVGSVTAAAWRGSGAELHAKEEMNGESESSIDAQV